MNKSSAPVKCPANHLQLQLRELEENRFLLELGDENWGKCIYIDRKVQMESITGKKQQEKVPHAGLKLEGACTFPLVSGAITDVNSTGYWMRP